MKKIFLSLAALMIMTATVMTSCSSEALDEVAPEVVTPETGTHVETLTIAFPDLTETRVGVDSDNKLTGWEEGDEVTLVQTSFEEVSDNDNFGMTDYVFSVVGTYTFRCTDAANGIFIGTLPNGTFLYECQLAFYNATDFAADERSFHLCFSPKNRASQNMKDVVMMVAKNDGYGKFAIEIFGSILQVTNINCADVTAKVKYSMYGYGRHYSNNRIHFERDDDYSYGNGYIRNSFEVNYTASDSNQPITLSKDAPTYVYIPVYDASTGDVNYAVGLSAEGDATNECSLVPFKTNPGNAKLFKKKIIGFGVGTAEATIGDSNVDVKWVQLWAGGPKFAAYNVGVTDGKAESCGGHYYWGSHIDQDLDEYYNSGSEDLSGDDDTATKLWGDKWRMPTGAELQALIDNCASEWTTVNGVNGLKFTGTGDYASNSVFLPAAGETNIVYKLPMPFYHISLQGVWGEYWASTLTPDWGKTELLRFRSDYLKLVQESTRFYGFSVRAVLAE